jgi:hypothetical protein
MTSVSLHGTHKTDPGYVSESFSITKIEDPEAVAVDRESYKY